jgi:hypothetical protein
MSSDKVSSIIGTLVIAIFMICLSYVLGFLPAFGVGEYKRIECRDAVVVDRYNEDNHHMMAFDDGTIIIKVPATDEEYYRHAIGDTVEICFYKADTEIQGSWRIEE